MRKEVEPAAIAASPWLVPYILPNEHAHGKRGHGMAFKLKRDGTDRAAIDHTPAIAAFFRSAMISSSSDFGKRL